MKVFITLLLVSCAFSLPTVKNLVKNAVKAIEPQGKALGKCLVAAAKSKAVEKFPWLKIFGFGRRNLWGLSELKDKAKKMACQKFAGTAIGACKKMTAAGVKKAAAWVKSKAPKMDSAKVNACLTKFAGDLCSAAVKHGCGRRLLDVRAKVMAAAKAVANFVKPEAKTLFNCVKTAAKEKAIGAIKAKLGGMVPSTVFKMMGMGRRNLWGVPKFIKAAAKKVAAGGKAMACKALAGKAVAACDAAVNAGVAKGAAFVQKKFPKLAVPAAKACFKTFGQALCKKAVKKVCA